jgi:hypothetical protein
MRYIDITHTGSRWVAQSGGQVVYEGQTKEQLVREVATVVRTTDELTSVRIHGKTGLIDDERTFRSAGPRREG